MDGASGAEGFGRGQKSGASMTDLRWTDDDGSEALLTTDDETCGDGDALAVLAITKEVYGGIYLTPDDARKVIAFLSKALTHADGLPRPLTPSPGQVQS
jgi:hypothetical protein